MGASHSHRIGLLVGALVSCAAPWACSTDYSVDAQSGASDGAVNARADQADATRVDDASGDVAVSADAAGTPDAASSTGTFCASVTPTPIFCADFDGPGAASPSAGWDSVVTDAGTALSWSTTTFKSAPRALHATTSAGETTALTKTLPMLTQFTVELDVLFTALPSTASAAFAPVMITPPVFPGKEIYFFVASGKAYFQEYGSDYSADIVSPTLNAWHHITIALTLMAAQTVVDASFDGALAWKGHVLQYAWPAMTTPTLQVGLPSVYMATTADALIDNVVVTGK